MAPSPSSRAWWPPPLAAEFVLLAADVRCVRDDDPGEGREGVGRNLDHGVGAGGPGRQVRAVSAELPSLTYTLS